MHILLTNDDGHEAPGIQAMKTILNEKGYRVSMVAPSAEQSATSMSTTTATAAIHRQLEGVIAASS